MSKKKEKKERNFVTVFLQMDSDIHEKISNKAEKKYDSKKALARYIINLCRIDAQK